MKGLVTKSTGSFYDILAEDGKTYKARIRGKFRIQGIITTNPIAVGDRVEFHLKDDGTAVIDSIEPRKNHLLRKATKLSSKYHILAANVDQVLVLYTPQYPETLLSFIDRILVAAEAFDISPVLLINKMDLFEHNDEAGKKIEKFKRIYKPTNYPILEVSAATGYQLDRLRNLMKNKISVFAGNSGTGKSSLVKALIPDSNIRIGDLSQIHRQGKHTTTFAELHPLPFGGYIIDTPGIRAFGSIDFEPRELKNYFPEFRRFSPFCKFHNCMHVNEPGCEVKKRINSGEIPSERYKNYLDILEELKNQSPYRTKKFE